MTENNPFREALIIFEGGRRWIKYRPRLDLFNSRKGCVETHHCSGGVFLSGPGIDLHGLEVSELLAILKQVIKEQYPRIYNEILEGCSAPVFVAGFDCAVVEAFNDHFQTTFQDIELVFGKAAVCWEERII